MESNGHERRAGMHVRMLMAQTDQGFVVVDGDGRIRLFNEAAETLFGTARAEACGRTLEEIGISELVAIVDAAGSGAEPTPAVIDLRERVLSCSARQYEDADGRGVAIVVRDDTELVAQHERSRAILEGASDGLVVFAPDDRITYANPAACTLLGAGQDELIGRHATLHELLGVEMPEDADETPEPGAAQEIELAEPDHRVLVVRTNPVVDRGGSYLGCVSSLHDVTAEREIAVMKNEFVSMVSHELRTPLTSIKGYVDLIVEGEAGEINEIQREFLQIVQENSDRLVSLINDLLDISRMESGRVHLRIEPLELNEIVQGVCDTFRTMADQGAVELSWDAEEDLPRAAGDRDRVGQVLMNFVSNAIKYSPGGGSARVSLSIRDDMVLAEVSDTGIGIAPDDQEKLFSKFYRVDSSLTREIGGTGLGLSICKSVVELLGGEVGAHSVEGEGSTFWFTLPVARADQVRTPTLEGPATAGGTVLVVDSDPEVADLIGTFLAKRGYAVSKAHSADEALERALADAPLLITLDVMLEEAEGFDLLHRLKQDARTAGIPVLVVSVSCDEGRSRRMGADEYLEKPIDQKRLVAIADALVGQVASPVALVVDDDRSIVGALTEMLKRRGFAVLPAYDGAEAMAAVARRRPDLVLLDLQMPVMDGYEVIAALKSAEETAEIPIVVMTAHRIDHCRIDLVEMASESLSKPVLPEQLAERVEQLLSEGVE